MRRRAQVDQKPIDEKPVSALPARWRALKRLANDGHDHTREQEFFAGEIRARRGTEDKVWSANYWAGWAYQILSVFGRSMVRPIVALMVTIATFAWLYLRPAEESADEVTNFFAWSLGWISQNVLGSPASNNVPCVEGTGDQMTAALQLAFQKGLIIPGLTGSDKLNQIYACLYGIHPYEGQPTDGSLGRAFTPIIPDSVAWLTALQSLISIPLIFLFLLAIRNHFRIR